MRKDTSSPTHSPIEDELPLVQEDAVTLQPLLRLTPLGLPRNYHYSRAGVMGSAGNVGAVHRTGVRVQGSGADGCEGGRLHVSRPVDVRLLGRTWTGSDEMDG